MIPISYFQSWPDTEQLRLFEQHLRLANTHARTTLFLKVRAKVQIPHSERPQLLEFYLLAQLQFFLGKSEVNSFSFFTLSLKNMEFFFEMACKSTAKRSLFSRPSKSRQHQQHTSKITRFLSQRWRHQLSAKRHRTGLPPFFSHLWRATYSGWVCLTCFWAFWSAWHTAFSPSTRRFCVFFFPISKSYSWKAVVHYRGFL